MADTIRKMAEGHTVADLDELIDLVPTLVSRIEALEAEVSDLDGRVTALEGGT